MTKYTKIAVALVALASLFSGTQMLHAQQTKTVQIQQSNPYYAPPAPKLGVMLSEGYGFVEVNQTYYGTPAARLGLEPGDRILRVNGRTIMSRYELENALREAMQFRNGHIDVVIDNVRARHGDPYAERYVFAHTNLDSVQVYTK